MNMEKAKEIAQATKETLNQAKKLIPLPLPNKSYYKPGPAVRRYSVTGVNPFEIRIIKRKTKAQRTKGKMDYSNDALLINAINSITVNNTENTTVVLPEAPPMKKSRRNTIAEKPTYIIKQNKMEPHNPITKAFHMPNLGDEFIDFNEFNEVPKTPRPYSSESTNVYNDDQSFEPLDDDISHYLTFNTKRTPEIEQNSSIKFTKDLSATFHITRKVNKGDSELLEVLQNNYNDEIQRELNVSKKEQAEIIRKTREMLKAGMDLFESL